MKRIYRHCGPDPFASVEHEDDTRLRAGSTERSGICTSGRPDVYNLAGIISRALALIIDIVIVSLIAFLAAVYGSIFGIWFNFGGIGIPRYILFPCISSFSSLRPHILFFSTGTEGRQPERCYWV